MPRRPRRDHHGTLHHITARGNNRREIYSTDDDRETFYGLLASGCRTYDVRCHADCLMGNHYHLVLEAPVAAVSKLLWFVNNRYAIAYNDRHGRVDHLFGRRFHSSTMPDDRAAMAVMAYVALNPVRSRLSRHPAGWPAGSYRAHVRLEAPRPHLATEWARELFARHDTSLEERVARALREAGASNDQAGRPTLDDLFPDGRAVTREHVRHAGDVFGYARTEIAAHLGAAERTLSRWLAERDAA